MRVRTESGIILLCISFMITICLLFSGCAQTKNTTEDPGKTDADTGLLKTADDIGLHDRDGGGTNYAFDYDGKEFRAVFSYDTWTVFDSYKIVNEDDIKIICRALADIHPVHGSDRISYRTEEDMAYEWLQHNIAFMVLPKDDPLLEDAKNVDLDPADQGRSFREIYEDRTGKKFSL